MTNMNKTTLYLYIAQVFKLTKSRNLFKHVLGLVPTKLHNPIRFEGGGQEGADYGLRDTPELAYFPQIHSVYLYS